MFLLTTMGSDDVDAVFPFATAKAAMGQGDSVSMFLMGEATRLGTTMGDVYEITSPGMPSLGERRDTILEMATQTAQRQGLDRQKAEAVAEAFLRGYTDW